MESNNVFGSVWGHIAELISRLKIAVAALVVATLAVLIVPIDPASFGQSLTSSNYNTISTLVISRLMSDMLPQGVELLPLDWFAPFTVYIYVSIFLGFVISSPIIIYQIYKFVAPALYENEQRLIFLFVGSFTGLFLLGVAMGYMMLVPVTFRMLLGITNLLGISPKYEFSSFFTIILGGVLMTGLFFTFPVFFLSLVKIGVLKTSMISKARKIIYVGVFIVICIITPDPTILSDLILFVPTVILMELSLIIGKKIEGDRDKKKSMSVVDTQVKSPTL